MRDFNHVLAELNGDFDAWRRIPTGHDLDAITDAVIETRNLPRSIRWSGSSIAFRTDSRVYDLGLVDGPHGEIFDTILLRVPAELEIVAAVEDDGIRAQAAFRGNPETFARLASGLWLFQGRCFTNLRANEAA